MSDIQTSRCWTVDSLSREYRETLEVRWLYPRDVVEREVDWFEQFTFYRAVCQSYVEEVLGLPLKKRREVYKRWRQELGDDRARTYAKFAEYLIKEGEQPKWFIKEITQGLHTKLQMPSSLSPESVERYKGLPRVSSKNQTSLL